MRASRNVQPESRRRPTGRIGDARRRGGDLLLGLVLLLGGGLLGSCANPIMPSGGPEDQTPPAIVATDPPHEAVNVAPSRIRITFSEYVDAGSFARALTITPEIPGRLEYRWRRRSVEITLPEPLREGTTYVLTIDTNLRDAHGVALREPLTVAFSTGPVINQGRLAGQVIDPTAGTGIAGIDVFAYAAPDSTAPSALPDRPAYRTQTDDQGRFAFAYLREQPYFVAAVQDRNRNLAPDPAEPFAPPPRPVLTAQPGAPAETDAPRWLLTVLDTIPPEPRRVQARSRSRLEVRFSEAVRLTDRDPSAWSLRDSLARTPVAVRDVYMLPDDPRLVFLRTDLLAERPHVLIPAGIADSSGTPVAPTPVSFTPTALDDTLQIRFRRFEPAGLQADALGRYVLLPSVPPGVRFNQPVDDATLHARLAVTDTTGQPLAFTTSTEDGTAYALHLDPPLQEGQVIEVQVRQPRPGGTDTTFARVFQRIPDDALGSRAGYVAAADTSGPIVVELYPPPDSPRRTPYVTHARDDRYTFTGLPEGTYTLRAFVDRNGNQRWDGGRLVPYTPAEPLAWITDGLDVRPRWEQVREDTLRIPPR